MRVWDQWWDGCGYKQVTPRGVSVPFVMQVRSGRRVLVFNIRRNDYRLVVAAHFDRQIVYALRFTPLPAYRRI